MQNYQSSVRNTPVRSYSRSEACFFLAAGQVVILLGLIMGFGQAVGAHIGSHMVLKCGIRFIRTFFLCVVALTLCRLIYTTYLR